MILNSVKPLSLLFKPKSVNIYDPVFKMHSKLTVYFLLIFAIFISGHAYHGKPIDCIVGDNAMKATAEAICWVNGTFTFRNVTKKLTNGRDSWELRPEYQRYYQWIIILLLLQAALSSIPERLWKAWENGRIQQLCSDLISPAMTPCYEDYQKRKDLIVAYLSMNNSRIHGTYVFRYVACEVMNFLIVVINMYILNVIFDQFWSRYFPAILALFSTEGATFSTVASEIFPITAKCLYSDYGPSGTKQIKDALCLLTLNIVNEKVFAFLYIWYVLLLFVSGANLIARSVTLMSSTLRVKMIQSLSQWTVPLSRKKMKIILRGNNIGDWFIIFLLGQNLNRYMFRDVLEALADGRGTLNNDI